MSHIYKQVAKPKPKHVYTVREAVTKHGDSWRLMCPDYRYLHRAHMECETSDTWDGLCMKEMERGEMPRIRSEDLYSSDD